MKHYDIYVLFKGDDLLRHVNKQVNSVKAIKKANEYANSGYAAEVRVVEVESNTIYIKEGK